jgi:hypothetical protein
MCIFAAIVPFPREKGAQRPQNFPHVVSIKVFTRCAKSASATVASSQRNQPSISRKKAQKSQKEQEELR